MNTTAISESIPVLNIEGLTIAYRHGDAWLEAVRDVSLRIDAGHTYGLVGESGSGKTTLALAIMRCLGEDGAVRRGTIEFAGRELLSLSESAMRQLWGAEMSLVPQDPLSSLNPSIRIGEQLAETLRHHDGLSDAEAGARAIDLLRMVRVPDPERVADSYPHQISGGMQQRVMIAMALSTEPQLLVLDEPTTNLDVTTQAAVLDLFRDLIRGRQTAALYVTHNLGVVARICDRVAVLYAGELVEDAPSADVFHRPLHPYTQGLLDSVPRLGQSKTAAPLQGIAGHIPPLGERPSACVYAPRCPLAIEKCHVERPPWDAPSAERRVRCHRWREILAGAISARQIPTGAPPARANGAGDRPVLHLQDVAVHYPLRRTVGQALAGRPPRAVRAVDGVSVTIPRGRTLGLVGESGSGKTTLARAIVGLVENTNGSMELLDIPLPPGLTRRNLDTLRHLQIVFQNPEEALNPYLTVGETLRQPLRTLLGMSRGGADAEVERLLAAVRLPASYVWRLPGQLSGGEKQRVAIARACASNPDLLIGDEPVSALDVSVQASILNLLGELQRERNGTTLFISHDLAVVGYLADDVAVIYAGRLMEVASAADLFEPPYHPYTEALLSAIPVADPDIRQEHIRLAGPALSHVLSKGEGGVEGDVPSQTSGPTGCPFHPRCPRFLGDVCVTQTPPWQVDENGKRIFCHIPLNELRSVQERVFRDG